MRKVIVVGAGRWARQGWAPLLAEHADRFTPVAVVDGPEVQVVRDGTVETTIPAPDGDILEGHRHQLRAFADWLDGGPPVATTVDDNRHSIRAVLTALGSAAAPPR